MIRKPVALLALTLVFAAPAWGGGAQAPSPTAPPASAPLSAPPASLSPAIRSALQQLSAEDFAAREKAVTDLQMALGQEMRALVDVHNPEAQARVVDLLTFDQGLCDWIKDILQQPADQQKAAFDFGLQPAVVAHVAHLYARDPALRLEAVRALRKFPDAPVSDLLAHAIDDRDQRVYVAAMEGAWDRPPTDPIVSALWNRAVAAQMATFHQQPPVSNEPLTFRGRQVQAINNGDNEIYLQAQDNELATDVLVHLKPPQVLPRIKAIFEEAEKAFARKNEDPLNPDESNIWMYMPTQEAMRNAVRLAGAYKSDELMPVLYRIATGPVVQQAPGRLPRGQPFYSSNRTWALALVVQLRGDTPADWNLRIMAQQPGQWVVSTQADEAAAALKLRDWWSKEHDKYNAGPDPRPVPGEDTHPQAAPPPGAVIQKPLPIDLR